MKNFSPLRDALPLNEIERALVIKLRHHGDVLTSSPVFSVLKAHAPHVEIDALVYADTAEMLTLHPAIQNVHTIDRRWKTLGPIAQLKAETNLYKTLKMRRYDLIIHLTEHWRGAWLCRLLKPRWSVAPAVSGRHKRWRASFSHIQSAPKNALRHVVEANLDALRRIGIRPTPDEKKMLLVPGQEAVASVAMHLSRLGLQEKNFIHIHPASRWFFKCWSIDYMAELIERLQQEGHAVVLTAAPSDDEKLMLEAIQERLTQPAFSLSGELSLKELAALIASAKLFIGVDSAPMHMASALGTPLVVLFGPSGDKQWGPWGTTSRVVTSQKYSCRPCGIDGCGGGKVSDCLMSITVDDVLSAAHELLTP